GSHRPLRSPGNICTQTKHTGKLPNVQYWPYQVRFVILSSTTQCWLQMRNGEVIAMSDQSLMEFRAHKDHLFATDPHSPLTPQQKIEFTGLNYFPEIPELRFEVQVEPFPEQEEVEIQTSTGDIRTFRRYGRFQFQVDGQEAELTIFADRNGFFLPFVDSLAGKET